MVSDLGLVIRPDACIDEAEILGVHLLVICGGYRTLLTDKHDLDSLLKSASAKGITLAGLWNGAWFLGAAGVLEGYRCAIHPEHRPALADSREPRVIRRTTSLLHRVRIGLRYQF